MRFYSKLLAALVVAIVLQVSISGAGGWSEISFEARCLVSLWYDDPALMQRLIEQAQQAIDVAEPLNRLRRRQDRTHRSLLENGQRPLM